MDWTHRLRLRQLQTILSLARTGNVSRSAQELNTTQPALSKWLKELEAELKLPLFERLARGLRLTSYGEALVEHARRIEGHLDTARDDMRALQNGGSGIVNIGTSGVAASDVVPRAVTRLLRKMPRVQVRLSESTMNELTPQLLHGELDIIVGRTKTPRVENGVKVETLYQDPVVFVAAHDHPLVDRLDLTWNDMRAYTWIVWPQGTPMRDALENALAATNQALPSSFVESNSAILNITMLQDSHLIGTASYRATSRFERMHQLRILPMELGSAGSVSMYWRQNNENRTAVALALECLRECV